LTPAESVAKTCPGWGTVQLAGHLRDVLAARRYRVRRKEYAGGTDYLVWRGAISDGVDIRFGH